jgi:hypothetical protein
MKRCLVFALAAVVVIGAHGQGMKSDADVRYGVKTVFSVFADFSNDSSHMFLGQEQNRKIVGIGVSYARRLKATNFVEWTYEAEMRPVNFVRDPFVTGVATLTIQGTPTGIVTLPFSGTFSGPTMADCASGTTVTTGMSSGVGYAQTITQQCSSRWTYAGGINPLGQRVSFATRHRVQPYVVANGGFLVSPRDLPVNDSARFNFTFEGGAGVEWFRDRRHSIALDYRVQHLSNAYRGHYNPGIDSGIFRVTYRVGR